MALSMASFVSRWLLPLMPQASSLPQPGSSCAMVGHLQPHDKQCANMLPLTMLCGWLSLSRAPGVPSGDMFAMPLLAPQSSFDFFSNDEFSNMPPHVPNAPPNSFVWTAMQSLPVSLLQRSHLCCVPPHVDTVVVVIVVAAAWHLGQEIQCRLLTHNCCWSTNGSIS